MSDGNCYCSVVGGREYLCAVCASALKKQLRDTQMSFLEYIILAEYAADVLDYASSQGVKRTDIEPPEGYEMSAKGGCSLRVLARRLGGRPKRRVG